MAVRPDTPSATPLETAPDISLGFLCSLLAHGLFLYFLIFFAHPRGTDFGAPIVYSITLEGGERLGGVSQVPKDDKKTALAPPKNVSEKKEEIEKPSEEKKDEKPEVPDEKAEVSVSEKKEEVKKEPEKPKEKPTEKPKPTPKAEPKKTPKPKVATAADIDKEYQKAMQRYLGESTDAGGKGFGAGKLGGKSMGGGTVRPPEFFQYRDRLKAYIKRGWAWYDTSATLSTWVVFDIAEDGTLSNIEISQSSGNREFDDSVYRAVVKASPVPRPPENVYQWFEKVRIEFTPGE